MSSSPDLDANRMTTTKRERETERSRKKAEEEWK